MNIIFYIISVIILVLGTLLFIFGICEVKDDDNKIILNQITDQNTLLLFSVGGFYYCLAILTMVFEKPLILLLFFLPPIIERTYNFYKK